MIAVVIVSVLAAVALPSFLDSIRKSRRSEAFTAISAIQQAQERHRSNNPTYSDSLAALGVASATTSPGGYYTVAVSRDSTNPGTVYVVSAVAVSGKSQAQDGSCSRLAVRMSAGLLTYASCASCETFTFSESDACWKR